MTPIVLWQPRPWFTLWKLPVDWSLYLSVWRLLFVVGVPLEWPSVRVVPDRYRVAAGPFSASWWRQ